EHPNSHGEIPTRKAPAAVLSWFGAGRLRSTRQKDRGRCAHPSTVQKPDDEDFLWRDKWECPRLSEVVEAANPKVPGFCVYRVQTLSIASRHRAFHFYDCAK